MRPLTIMSLVIVALVAVLAACSDDSQVAESVPGGASDEPLVFGSGSIPETVPEGFPIPSGARVGSTMVDRTRGVTEVVIVYPADVPDVVKYFETNLSAVGYTVDESSGTNQHWEIEFSNDGLEGDIVVDTSGSGLSQGTIRLVQPVSG